MVTVTLTQARARLSELLDKAETGQKVAITRRGRVVAHLSRADPDPPVRPKKKRPFRMKEMTEYWASMPWSERPSVELLRELRDEKY